MKYRRNLPQLNGTFCLSDGGMETTLVFHDKIELPEFSSIVMVASEDKRNHLRHYFAPYLKMAIEQGVGFVLESPTWRSSWGWAEALGFTPDELDQLNREAIDLLLALRQEYETAQTPIVVSGCIGPRGDGYVPDKRMTEKQAQDYHLRQVEVLADAGVDCVTAMTINYVEEAIGIALAARMVNVPSIISFTVETNGRLVTGESLEDAIKRVDVATESAPAYFMVNCAHPEHFEPVLDPDSDWVTRIGGIRANASKCSHQELDNSEKLDIGNPQELGEAYSHLTRLLPNIQVLGGCCGTDIRHIHAIAHHQQRPLWIP
jgi:S-methylmethionine-dependent homocysteine/selenocysteine methylase